MRIRRLSSVLIALCLAATGCSTELSSPAPADVEDLTVTSIPAGPDATVSLGIVEYEVTDETTFAGLDRWLTITALDAAGAELGVVRATREAASGAVVIETQIEGRTVTTTQRPGSVEIARNGEVLAILTGDAEPDPAVLGADLGDVADVLTLQSIVISDAGLTQALEMMRDAHGTVAYRIPDCPWYATAAFCLASGTGIGFALCMACGFSYLL